MNDAVCAEQAAVRSAADRGDWGEVMAHVARCEACAADMPALMEAHAGSADALLARRSEDEAAVILADGFESPLASPASAGDAVRLARARAALDELDGDGEGGGTVLAFPARRWLPAALVAAAAAVLVVAIGPNGLGLARWLDERGEAAVEMRAVVGEKHCFSTRLHKKRTCQWDPARQTLTVNYRLEEVEGARYLAVFARHATGEVWQVFPEAGQAQTPLAGTRSRKSDVCHAGLCWLTGGEYAGVEPGPMTLIGVFDDKPLPLDELSRAVKAPGWSDAARVVDRLELEVAR